MSGFLSYLKEDKQTRGAAGKPAVDHRLEQQMKEVAAMFADDAGADAELDNVMGDTSSQASGGPPVVKKMKASKKVYEEEKKGEKEEDVEMEEYGSESNLSCDSKDLAGSDSDESMVFNAGKFGVIKTTKRGMYDFAFLKDAEFLAKSAEEQAAFIEVQMELRLERQMMKKRHDQMSSIEDLLEPLLSGNLLRTYSKLHPVKDFKGKGVPVNFKGGHSDYATAWRFLFLYEVYNILTNSRRADAKEEEHAEGQNKRGGRGGPGLRSQRTKWPGYAVCGLKEGGFQTLRLYDVPPHANTDAAVMASQSANMMHIDQKSGKQRNNTTDDNLKNLRSVRDDDLLLLSETVLDLKGKEDIK